MNPKEGKKRSALGFWFLAGAALLLTGVGLARFVIAPLILELPSDYSNESSFAVECRLREAPDGEWQEIILLARRVDQTWVDNGEVIIVQSSLYWITEDDQVVFENHGLYGVNQHTRQNVTGYGDQKRGGQFLFPMHLQQTSYDYWDSMFIGLRRASFSHIETRAGIPVYVFSFSGSDMDETEGNSYLADVPERYSTFTDGVRKLWIEPLSGIIIDYKEQGVSYFVEKTTGERLGNFFEWSDRFTRETEQAQLRLARLARLRIRGFETWLPGGFLLVGVLAISLELNRRVDRARRLT